MTEGVDISSLREVVRFLSFLLRHCENEFFTASLRDSACGIVAIYNLINQ
ncbi:hypothetical protein [Helicobacter sp.]|nr:hypothetical protein [Helicobacter sp.]MCI5632869.1 hypothetical protein [Helicobacter sp.]